jgi:Fe-S cluster biogenesis protein NfuA
VIIDTYCSTIIRCVRRLRLAFHSLTPFSPAMSGFAVLRSAARQWLASSAAPSLALRPYVTLGQLARGEERRTSLKSRMPPSRSFFIQTEATPNPNSLKFLPGRTILPEQNGSGMYFTRGDKEYRKSPLAVKIFSEVDDAQAIFLGRDFITITKNQDASFNLMKPIAFAAVMDFFAEGKPVVLDAPLEPQDTDIHEDDDEVVAMIKELLSERIRPTVQDDGGDIFYKGFDPETGTVQLQLAGACSGCPSSSVTLKQGVENMLMHYIPE